MQWRITLETTVVGCGGRRLTVRRGAVTGRKRQETIVECFNLSIIKFRRLPQIYHYETMNDS